MVLMMDDDIDGSITDDWPIEMGNVYTHLLAAGDALGLAECG